MRWCAFSVLVATAVVVQRAVEACPEGVEASCLEIVGMWETQDTTSAPTRSATLSPTIAPSLTEKPTRAPTGRPTRSPTTLAPTQAVTRPPSLVVIPQVAETSSRLSIAARSVPSSVATETVLVPPGKYWVRFSGNREDLAAGDYIALSREARWVPDFLQVLFNDGAESRDFGVDLTGFIPGTELFLMYFSSTDNWAMKALTKLVIGQQISLEFDPEDTDVPLGNPGAGFMELNTTTSSNFHIPTIPIGRNTSSSVWWNVCLNNGEAENDILPLRLLAELDSALQAFQRNGKQVYIRFWYNAKGEKVAVPKSEPEINRVEKHQAQLASIIRQYASAVAGVDAGLLGAYGEWHGSRFGEINEINYQSRMGQLRGEQLSTALAYKRVVDTWYRFFSGPNDPPIQLRRHFHKRLLINNIEQWRKTNHHVDCFLASATDMGTFVSDGTATVTYGNNSYLLAGMRERLDLGHDTSSSVIGETCFNPNPEELRLGCQAARTELRALHWTAVNLLWYKPFIDSWKEEGCFDEIHAKLGYRWHFESLKMDLNKEETWLAGLEIRLVNNGWSASTNNKMFHLVLLPVEDPRALSGSRNPVRIRLDTLHGWIPSKDWAPEVFQSIYLPNLPRPQNVGPIFGLYRVFLQVQEPFCENPQRCPSPVLSTRLDIKQSEFFTYHEASGLNDFRAMVCFVQSSGQSDGELARPQVPDADTNEDSDADEDTDGDTDVDGQDMIGREEEIQDGDGKTTEQPMEQPVESQAPPTLPHQLAFTTFSVLASWTWL